MISIRRGVEAYLAMRRAMGFKLVDPGNLLREFARFLQRQGTSCITSELIVRWAKLRRNVHPARWARRLRTVRRFAQYWQATDPRTQVPPLDLLPHRYRRRTPYLFGHQEILGLMRTAERLPSKAGFAYSTLIGLLASTGLRGGEARALNREDVDLAHGVLTIRKTKFGKSRLVPIHATTKKALARYARRRDKRHPHPRDPAFFLSCRGGRFHKSTILSAFGRLCRKAGLVGTPSRARPSLHALRHRFAVTTLRKWYRAGLDVGPRMPVLSTFLGHTLISNTYWYLTAEPELMRLAGARLENVLGNLP
jgi:integrase